MLYNIYDELLLDPSDRLTDTTQLNTTNTSNTNTNTNISSDYNTSHYIPQDVDDLNSDIARCAINLLAGDSYYYKRNHDIVDNSMILTRRYQMLNESLSTLSQEDIKKILKETKPQGRFQQFIVSGDAGNVSGDAGNGSGDAGNGSSGSVVLDIAHNPEAFLALGQKLKHVYGDNRRFRYVYCVLNIFVYYCKYRGVYVFAITDGIVYVYTIAYTHTYIPITTPPPLPHTHIDLSLVCRLRKMSMHVCEPC